ncbi:MAG: hypothetical protein AB7N80_10450 [Bdellovibrionales bacterium]
MIFRGPIAMGWVLVAGGLILWLPRWRRTFETAALVTSIATLLTASQAMDSSAALAIVLTGVLPALGFYYHLRRQTRLSFWLMIACLPLGIVIAQGLADFGFLQQVNYFTNQPRFFMILWLYAAEVRANSAAFAPNSSLFLSYAFSPAQLLTNICLPTSMFKLSPLHWEEVLKGLEILALILLYMVITLTLFQNLNREDFRFNSWQDFVTFGGLNYLKYYFLSYASLSSAEAAFRFLGYDLLSMFKTPFLAPSPHERWQRWSTTFYEFLKFMVFIPLLRRLKSPFFAVLITFWVSFLLHEVAFFLRLSDEESSFYAERTMMMKFVFFTLHGLAVYASLKTAKKWPSGQALRGWAGCALTFLIMAVIHAFAP